MSLARLGETVTTLPNGLVLAAGGQEAPSKPSFASAELYDSSTQRWRSANPMAVARDGHTATVLQDGRILVAGGFVPARSPAIGEVYVPDPLPLPASGRVDDGVYDVSFSPAFSMAITQRGNVDVQMPGWIGVEFGFDAPAAHAAGTWAADIGVVRLDHVFDHGDADRVVDSPPDLAGWLTAWRGLEVVGGPTPITVGGLPATVLDVVAGKDGVVYGPIPDFTEFPAGMGPGGRSHLIVLRVHDAQVVISVGLVDDVSAEHFQRAVEAFQPMIDSIVWE
jgi:hypothetical protein